MSEGKQSCQTEEVNNGYQCLWQKHRQTLHLRCSCQYYDILGKTEKRKELFFSFLKCIHRLRLTFCKVLTLHPTPHFRTAALNVYITLYKFMIASVTFLFKNRLMLQPWYGSKFLDYYAEMIV